MKRIVAKKLFLFCMVSCAVMLQSCGSSGKKAEVDPTDAAQVTQAAIAAADGSIALTESPVFGTLPSIYARESAATDSVSRFAEVKYDADRETKEKAAEAWSQSLDSVKAHYAALMQKQIDALAGKNVPLQFSGDEFESGTATIGGELNVNEIDVKFDMILARGLGFGEDKGVSFEYIGKDGEVYHTVNGYSKIFNDCYLPDGTITTQTAKGVRWSAVYSLYVPDLENLTAIRASFAK